MGDGISDLVSRGEASDEECDAAVMQMLEGNNGTFVWWPGGRHHNAVCRLNRQGKLRLVDISDTQETKFQVYKK